MLAASCAPDGSALLAWGLFGTICMHEAEEFAWPGGFREWYVRYSPHVEPSMTVRFLVFINAVVPLAAAIAGAFFAAPWARFLWLIVASGVAINGVWHVQATVRGRRYSPGVVTGALLSVPLAAYAFTSFLRCGWVTPRHAITAAVYGAVYWIFSEGRKLLNRAPRRATGAHLSVLR